MRKLLLLWVILGLSDGLVQAQPEVFRNEELNVLQLDAHTWIIETSDHTSMYLLEGTEKALLIDTGTKCLKLDEIVRKFSSKPLSVVITHMHGDHAGNIHFFNEIYLHPADTVLMGMVAPYKGKLHFIDEGYVFDLGNRKIEVSHMPAHTPGSIVLLDPSTASCYSGDAFGSGQVWLQLRPFSPMQTYVNSCKRMEDIMDHGITKLFCGHYYYVGKPYDKSYLMDMRLLAESILDGTASGVEDYPTKISIGGNKPMIANRGEAKIVFDAEHIR